MNQLLKHKTNKLGEIQRITASSSMHIDVSGSQRSTQVSYKVTEHLAPMSDIIVDARYAHIQFRMCLDEFSSSAIELLLSD